jgi:hypothetical protein
VDGITSALVLFATILTVLAFGIATTYGAVAAILNVLAPRLEEEPTGAVVLVPSQNHASGD